MRLTALAGLFACTLIFVASPKVHAQSKDLPEIGSSNAPIAFITNLADEKKSAENNGEAKVESIQPAQPTINDHIVEVGENLSKIAEKYGTTWKRIFDKNTTISNPDVISVGDILIIPNNDEVIPERVLPQAAPIKHEAGHASTATARTSVAASPRGSSTGNSYYYGYCTWYAKTKRPDMPNNLGNADTWVSRAALQGFVTSSAPRAGAIGQQGMHVVYVESVNGDGTVNVSEMNYEGYGVTSSRTVAASNFSYIY